MRTERLDLRPERPDLRPGRLDLRTERPNLKPERLDLRPKMPDLRPEMPDLRPERLDLRPDRPDLRPDRLMGGTNGRTNELTDERKSPCVLQDFVSFGAPPSLFRHLICLLKPSQALNWLSKPSHALF